MVHGSQRPERQTTPEPAPLRRPVSLLVYDQSCVEKAISCVLLVLTMCVLPQLLMWGLCGAPGGGDELQP